SGKTADREVEASPEEMHRARLAEKAAAEQLEDTVDLNKRAPKAMGRRGVISGVGVIFREADRVRDLVWHFIDGDRDTDAGEELGHASIEFGNCLRLERQRLGLAQARACNEAMADEIEFELEVLALIRDRRGAEPARRHIERGMPAMVEPGRESTADIADDLRTTLQSGRGVAPIRIGQTRPKTRHGFGTRH